MQENWRKQNKTKYVNEFFAPVFDIDLTKYYPPLKDLHASLVSYFPHRYSKLSCATNDV